MKVEKIFLPLESEHNVFAALQTRKRNNVNPNPNYLLL